MCREAEDKERTVAVAERRGSQCSRRDQRDSYADEANVTMIPAELETVDGNVLERQSAAAHRGQRATPSPERARREKCE